MGLVTFHLVSDVHLEFDDTFRISSPSGPGLHVCLLAGDIGHPTRPHYGEFLRDTKSKFDHVVVVAGNHEYYSKKKGGHHAKVEEVLEAARQSAVSAGCVFLERESYVIPLDELKVTILGATLWSHIDPKDFDAAKQGLNDFKRIYHGNGKFWTPGTYNNWHRRDVEWLEREIDDRRDEILVVMTHHCPTIRVIDPVYHDHPLNSCFVTDLERLFSENVKLWACGHSHKRGIAKVNGSLCALNPRGYPGENGKFSEMRFSLSETGEMI